MSDASSRSPQRMQRIQQVLKDCARRREAGETIAEKDVIAAHADLMPELGEYLPQLRGLERARQRAIEQGGGAESQAAATHDVTSEFHDAPTIRIPGYQLIREISRGGQAAVFLATQESTGQRVAIKVMHEGPLATATGKARFDREVQILASLKHPSIVSIIDRGQTPAGLFYFVMEHIDGRPLDQFWDQAAGELAVEQAPQDPSESLRLFMKICDAVNVAHLRGVVHRDLKPSNILIDRQGAPHVLDFGLARTPFPSDQGEATPRPVTVTGQFLGSLPWASPEQAEGAPQKIDPRTDVYALGVILYQMLTGEFPYQVVGNIRDVLDNIMRAKPTPPSKALESQQGSNAQPRTRRTHISPTAVNASVEAIVLKALSKSRQDRYQTAGELASDIANHLAGKPTQATDLVSRSYAINRHALWAAAISAPLAIICIVWFVMTQPATSPSQSPQRQNGSPASHNTTTPPTDPLAESVPDRKGWVQQQPLPQGNDLRAMAFGNGIYVAIGEFGTLLVSTDASSWTRIDAGVKRDLNDIVFGLDRFVVVGDHGTVLTSGDGKQWRSQASGTERDLRGLAVGDEVIVAVGEDAYRGETAVVSTRDGELWRSQILPLRNGFMDVAYGNGRFVAVGGRGTLAVSMDGFEWELGPQSSTGKPLTSPSSRSRDELTDEQRRALELKCMVSDQYVTHIEFVNGRFLACGTYIHSSKDGKQWTSQERQFTLSLKSLAYGNERYLAVTSNYVYSSTDGQLWAEATRLPDGDLYHIEYVEPNFYAVGSYGKMVSSRDGANWNRISAGRSEDLEAVCWGDHGFVAVGDDGAILTSATGRSWTVQKSLVAEDWQAITFADGKYVAVGEYGTAISSVDGRTWSKSLTGSRDKLACLCYGNGLYLAGGKGTIAWSPDGQVWQRVLVETDDFFVGLIYLDDRFVASGERGAVFTSPDGKTWQCQRERDDQQVYSSFLGDGVWMHGFSGSVGISADGKSWTTHRLSERATGFVTAGCRGGSRFVCAGWNGTIAESSDGQFWTLAPQTTKHAFNGVAYSPQLGRFVVVGDGNSIVTRSFE